MGGGRPEGGRELDLSGFLICFRSGDGQVIPSLSLSKESIEKVVALVKNMKMEGSAPLASLQKLAGKLNFAPRAIMGRFGMAATKPIYQLKGECGGELPRHVFNSLRCCGEILAEVAPRFIM